MSFLTVNYKQAESVKQNNEPLPAGIYEMIMKSATHVASRGGHENITFDFVVRKDLDAVPELAGTNAKAHGRHLFQSIWTKKDTGTFDEAQISRIAQLVEIPDGTQLETVDDFVQLCENKPIRMKVEVSENEFKGKITKRNNSWVNTWEKTKYPMQQSAQSMPAADTTISEGDLPF
ncbi:DUF669 domain-containing protein [Lactobacillus delbrueckii subsp. bulgaricus]|uniref:DUF669 domain-containing protein n=1 Tax=Lactobacillus delbrueckii TaxID=1584 RepID=UPI0021A86976|nr:DUF669 domain-containing protein [Lactobacillus delbrueckii]MCT3466607.1 DUF669 domain-containing protein [Lactobacillus delbrueckii subsp. bulgaricus]MCT3470855.1 DUF669 domain-containing protein [Lactobacillus delbrueckii subsp. bulgaricus]